MVLNTQNNGISKEIADIDQTIEKLKTQRRKLMEELTIMGIKYREPETVDIQDLISGYRKLYPSCRVSELKGYLIDLLEHEYNTGIEVSYPVIEEALSNEMFRYGLRKR